MPDIGTSVDTLKGLTPELLVIVFSVFLSYALRRVPAFPNNWVFPATIFVSELTYIVLGDPVAGRPQTWNIVHKLTIGVPLSVVGALVATAAHDKLIRPLAAKIPIFQFLLCDDGLVPAPADPPKPQD